MLRGILKCGSIFQHDYLLQITKNKQSMHIYLALDFCLFIIKKGRFNVYAKKAFRRSFLKYKELFLAENKKPILLKLKKFTNHS